MLTCEDCLHIEVCAYIKHDLPICSDFADRSKYVVREKGEWLNRTKSIRGLWDYRFDCSVCGQIFWHPTARDFNFCPNCGADMRAEEQNRARSDCDSADICIECWDEVDLFYGSSPCVNLPVGKERNK